MPSTQAWSRAKVLAILAGAAAFGLLLLAGAVAAVYLAVNPRSGAGQAAAEDPPATAGAPEGSRDAIAAERMLQISAADITAGTPSTTLSPVIHVPTPTETGPARIATGFPRTPEGAVGQLAAIVGDVTQTMSIPHAHEVYQAWSEPGAGPAQEWLMTQNVAQFLASAKIAGQEAGARARIEVTPAAGQIKGVDGSDWVLACVLLDIRASIVQSANVAYGHCERMTWDADADRWVIAAGDAPAPAPSTWSGTDLAAEAGWLTWEPVAP